jgi:hypothetical protein
MGLVFGTLFFIVLKSCRLSKDTQQIRNQKPTTTAKKNKTKKYDVIVTQVVQWFIASYFLSPEPHAKI